MKKYINENSFQKDIIQHSMKIMFTHQQTQINNKNNKKDMKAKQGSSKSKKDKISPINASENWHRVMIFRSKYKIYMVVKL